MKAGVVGNSASLRLAMLWLVVFVQAVGGVAQAQTAQLDGLRARHAELREALDKSAFKEPLVLTSSDTGDHVAGDVYAELKRPIADIGAAFKSAAKACDLLFLHLNVRACQAQATGAGETLALSIGPKRASAAGMVYHMSYALRVETDTPQYLRVLLTAADGPLSTGDYRIVFEAMPLDGQRVFLHFSYTYAYGALAKMAMGVYLATAGRAKIGFTVIGQTADGRPVYVGGERAALERNVMRYYLALLAYLSVSPGTSQQSVEERLRTWFQSTERYAPQLHEFDLDEYLDEKHKDLRRLAGAGR